MYDKKYDKIKKWVYSHKNGDKILVNLNIVSTGLVYLAYPIAIIILLFNKDPRIIKTILVPGISFLLLSILRRIVNLPRPYEKYDIIPIIKKDSKGKSFPSRHVFSSFVIASSLYNIWPYLGAFLLLIGIIIATTRVVGGVHFPIDVVAGGIIGIVSSYIGWSISFL